MHTEKRNRENVLALLCILSVTVALGVRLWAATEANSIQGPSQIAARGDSVFVNVDSVLYRVREDGMREKGVLLDAMGISGALADMQLLEDGTLLMGDRGSGTIKRCDPNRSSCERVSPPPEHELTGRFTFRLQEATSRIVICDNARHRILVHDLEGDTFRDVTEAGMLLYPNGLWTADAGPVYVADTNHHRVVSLELDAGGDSVVTTVLSGETDLGRSGHTWPVGLTRGPMGGWWVLNANGRMENADLVIYDPQGTALRRAELPEESNPFTMAWLAGRLLLTDAEHFTVYAIDSVSGSVQHFGDTGFQEMLSDLKARKEAYRDIADKALIILIGLLLAAAILAVRARIADTQAGNEKGATMDGQQVRPIRGNRISVKPWPTEIPLFVMIFTMALGFWMFLILSVVGLVYAIFIGLFVFVSHLAFVTYIRGSAVRLGPEQFPELHQRIGELSARAGLKRAPDAYLMQAGGALNALATKFLRSRMIILFSDLLDACGENSAARDMIIGHELGHIRAGHLRWLWFLIPGMAVPFLGSLYSQAREYTCDRYGAALCEDRRGALVGLTILAAGGVKGPQVNLTAFVRQRRDLNTGLMTIGKWMASHPPLCDRVAALSPQLVSRPTSMARGKLGAFGVIGTLFLLPILLTGAVVHTVMPSLKKAMDEAKTAVEQPQAELREQAPAPVEPPRADSASLVEEEGSAVVPPAASP